MPVRGTRRGSDRGVRAAYVRIVPRCTGIGAVWALRSSAGLHDAPAVATEVGPHRSREYCLKSLAVCTLQTGSTCSHEWIFGYICVDATVGCAGYIPSHYCPRRRSIRTSMRGGKAEVVPQVVAPAVAVADQRDVLLRVLVALSQRSQIHKSTDNGDTRSTGGFSFRHQIPPLFASPHSRGHRAGVATE